MVRLLNVDVHADGTREVRGELYTSVFLRKEVDYPSMRLEHYTQCMYTGVQLNSGPYGKILPGGWGLLQC